MSVSVRQTPLQFRGHNISLFLMKYQHLCKSIYNFENRQYTHSQYSKQFSDNF